MDQTDKIVAAILTIGVMREQVGSGLEGMIATYEKCLQLLQEREEVRAANKLDTLLSDEDKRFL